MEKNYGICECGYEFKSELEIWRDLKGLPICIECVFDILGEKITSSPEIDDVIEEAIRLNRNLKTFFEQEKNKVII